MSRPFRNPLGMVLSGGGSLCAWQAGCLDRLASAHGIELDHVLGFSIGSLNAAAYSLNRMELLAETWRRVDAARILRLSPRFSPPSLFGNESIREIISRGGGERRARRDARCELTVVSTCREDGARVYARYTPGGRGGWDAPIGAHLVASCSAPGILPPVRLRTGEYVRSCVDGGARGGQPMSFAALGRCRDVIVLQTVRPDELDRRRGFGLFPGRDQRARETIQGLVSGGLRAFEGIPDPPRVFRVYPSRPLEYSMLRFRGKDCGPAMRLGVSDADSLIRMPCRFLA
ncbi:MAG: patatin-like phospholipase family protein [Elusimicrobiota bacterium]